MHQRSPQQKISISTYIVYQNQQVEETFNSKYEPAKTPIKIFSPESVKATRDQQTRSETEYEPYSFSNKEVRPKLSLSQEQIQSIFCSRMSYAEGNNYMLRTLEQMNQIEKDSSSQQDSEDGTTNSNSLSDSNDSNLGSAESKSSPTSGSGPDAFSSIQSNQEGDNNNNNNNTLSVCRPTRVLFRNSLFSKSSTSSNSHQTTTLRDKSMRDFQKNEGDDNKA